MVPAHVSSASRIEMDRDLGGGVQDQRASDW